MNLRGGMERLSAVLTAGIAAIGLVLMSIVAFSRFHGGWLWVLAALGAVGGAIACVLGSDQPRWQRWNTTYRLSAPWLLLACFVILGNLQALAPPAEVTQDGGFFAFLGGLLLYAVGVWTLQGVILLMRFLADGFRQTPTQ